MILGAGPAGCAAAITLGRAGHAVRLVDRDAVPGDPLCGGFLSWRTARQLPALGIGLEATGAHRVDRLHLFQRDRCVETALPAPGYGLSRHALDSAMRAVALREGTELIVDSAKGFGNGVVDGVAGAHDYAALFLASGKHDIRGHSRPRTSDDPALGLRLRLPESPARTRLLAGAIELHLFDGGYVGIVLQEGGSANICLALRKSALSQTGGSPAQLLADVAATMPALAQRLGADWQEARIESIGAVPYGLIVQDTQPAIFRLGDQAAVIPSLAGEGISLALASGTMAARQWLEGGAGAAQAYQRRFAAAARRPVTLARLARRLAESERGARLAMTAAGLLPPVLRLLASGTRIAESATATTRLAPARPPA